MNNNNQTKLKNSIIKFLNKLNDGNKISIHELNQNHKEISEYIHKLGEIDNFPIINKNGILYFKKNDLRKTFNKYHIEDIVDILLEFKNHKVNITNENHSKIILDYIKNNKNGDTIDNIIFDFTAKKKDCIDSKNIKQIIFENATKRKTYSKEALMEKIVEYATNTKYAKDIASIIINLKKRLELNIRMQDILKEINLPRRDDEVYKIISSYKPYELTHCISYEMAIRNKDIQIILEKIKTLTLLSRELFRTDILHKNDSIPFYIIERNEQIEEILKNLDTLKIKLNIDFYTSSLTEIQSEVFGLITEYTVLLEEDYYMIYDHKEIVPQGMEKIFKEPNHYEPDRELNQYMDKAIEESIKNTYTPNPRYKNNYTVEDGYVTYQACYEDSKKYDINKIFPNFKQPMREFNQTQVAFNMSLPKDEIIAYISKIKDDYDKKNNSYKTLNQLLYGNDTRSEDKLEHKQKEKYADDFFIYDYYTQSDEEYEKKLESIQKKLSQFHGMKVEKGRNDYQFINYDEAQIEEVPIDNLKRTTSISFNELSECFKSKKNIIHYLATKTIEERYNKIKEYIDGKKYKTLIHHG